MPVELRESGGAFGEQVESGIVMVDGIGIGDVGTVVLRDRQLLSQDGLFMVVATISKENRELVSDPEIISRGFVYMKESEDLLDRSKAIVVKTIKECMSEKAAGFMAMKGRLKKALSSYLYSQTKRSPMILPIIIEL